MSALLTRIGDRLNPVLIKEVRQALNGRLFRIGYSLSLLAALCIAMVMVMSAQPSGAQLVVAMFSCMSVSLFAFVPFWSFLSMGGEWDENTHDLLVLSNLSPRRIVWGKFGAAFVQSLVSFLAFLPFFVFAFLLRGVNLPSLLMLLGGALVVSPCAAMVAIGISSLTTNRFLRVLLMVAVIAGLIVLAIASMYFISWILFAGFITPSLPQQVMVLALILSVSLVVAGFFGEVACVRLAHAEENRSTGLRLLVVVGLAGMLGWGWYAVTEGADLDFVSGMAIAIQWLLLLPCAHFAIEPEPLGRRVARQVPRNRVLALLTAPFLPGGGRGLLFWFTCEALVIGGAAFLATQAPSSAALGIGVPSVVIAVPGMPSPTTIAPATPATLSALQSWWDDGLWGVLTTALFGAYYIAVPALLVRSTTTPGRRLRARLAVPILFLAGIAFPALFLFLQQENVLDGGIDPWEHAFNPFWMLDESWNRNPLEPAPDGGIVLLVVTALALLLHLPRMRRGLAEVLAASASRRERERVPKSDAPPAT